MHNLGRDIVDEPRTLREYFQRFELPGGPGIEVLFPEMKPEDLKQMLDGPVPKEWLANTEREKKTKR